MKFNIFSRIMARARNDAGERIESLRFSVPALRVGVLEYAAGQLQTNSTALEGKPVKLYYPPEAVSDEKFLKSLETAPVVVGGHDTTTNEQNKKIDGWAHSVNYDTTLKAAMMSGIVKGAKEVAYIRGNLGSAGFGASAFVDIYDLKVENGVTPGGQEYNAIANELRATHVALAPHVRDPENKIRVTNAVCINTAGEIKTEGEEKTMELSDTQIALMIKNIAEEMAAEMRATVRNASGGMKRGIQDKKMTRSEYAEYIKDYTEKDKWTGKKNNPENWPWPRHGNNPKVGSTYEEYSKWYDDTGEEGDYYYKK